MRAGSREALVAIRDRWLAVGLSTAPADRGCAEAGVRAAYRRAGLPDDIRFVWALSPVSGAIIAESLMRGAHVSRRPADCVRPVPCLPDGAVDMLSAEQAQAIHGVILDPIATRINANVWRLIKQQVAASVRAPATQPLHGQHDALWLALADTLQQHGVEVGNIQASITIAESCGWWWPFSDVCVLSERPCFLATDEDGQLHCGSGAAVRYPDGWSIHARHGVVVVDAVVARSQAGLPH